MIDTFATLSATAKLKRWKQLKNGKKCRMRKLKT